MAHIFGEILAWSKQLTPWQNEAIRCLFKNGSLSPADKNEILEWAKIECGLSPEPDATIDLMLKEVELPAPPAPGQKIYLKGVRELINVNALKNDQRLSIGKQITIVFGENGTGKSGYARVTKRACLARAVEPVLPNVYAAPPAAQATSAIFEIEENENVRDEKWTEGNATPACLGRFAVFDSKCARVYIAENNELGFLPYGFDIVKGVGAITDEVKRQFQELAIPPKQDFLKPFLDDTEIGKQIAKLSPTTNEAIVRFLAEWTPEHIAQLSTKETELAKLKANSPQTIRAVFTADKKRIQTVMAAVDDALACVSEEAITEIRNKVVEVRKFDGAVATAAKLAFGEMNLPGIGGDAWRELILAAANFSTSEAYTERPFPATVEDARCVLCLQPVDTKTQERLKRFWDFIQDDASTKREKAKIALDSAIKILKDVPRAIPKEVAVLEDAFNASKSKVYALLPAYYESLAARVKAVEEAIVSNSWDAIPQQPASPIEQCNTEMAAIDARLGELGDDEKVSKTIQILSSEIAELGARRRLNPSLQSILDYLAVLKRSSLANQAANKITTNAISIKAAELQNQFVTDAFTKKVYDELSELGITRIKPKIDKKSEKGKVLLKVGVIPGGGISPELVFSEGERTAISLACFLAELAIGDNNCGIILDDPVSSLDHRVRARIVKRLVAEAAKRQVIIFTHDLVFYREICAACDQQKTSYEFQCVEALGAVTGILSDTPPWSAQKINQRTQKLDEKLAKLKKAEAAGDIPNYRTLFAEFYSQLRSTWERSVEELLFNQVIQRLEREVRTMSLDGVVVDGESVALIFEGMTRTSGMIDAHDHAVATDSGLPNSDEAVADLASFKTFVEKQKAKQKIAKGQNAHLKK
jgi:ABC-type dipeptide/oligopeptide/nickel transport system ATPase subunit